MKNLFKFSDVLGVILTIARFYLFSFRSRDGGGVNDSWLYARSASWIFYSDMIGRRLQTKQFSIYESYDSYLTLIGRNDFDSRCRNSKVIPFIYL